MFSYLLHRSQAELLPGSFPSILIISYLMWPTRLNIWARLYDWKITRINSTATVDLSWTVLQTDIWGQVPGAVELCLALYHRKIFHIFLPDYNAMESTTLFIGGCFFDLCECGPYEVTYLAGIFMNSLYTLLWDLEVKFQFWPIKGLLFQS